MRTNQLVQWVLILGILGLLTCTALQLVQLHQLNAQAVSLQMQRQTRDQLNQLLIHLVDAETGQRGYLLTGRAEYLLPYEQAKRSIADQLEKLGQALQALPTQTSRYEELVDLIRVRLATIDQTNLLRQTKGFADAQAVVLEGSGKQAMDKIRERIASMDRTFDETVQLLEAERVKQSRDLQWLVFLTDTLAIGLLLLLIGLVRRKLTPPLRDLSSSTIRRFTRTYTVALASIACLAIVVQLLLHVRLIDVSDDAHQMDLAGRQRMLSQQLVKATLVAQLVKSAEVRQASIAEIERVLTLWRQTHLGLQHGSAELGLPGRNSPEVVALFGQLEPHFQAMLQAGLRLTQVPLSEPLPADVVETLLQNESAFRTTMDAIVRTYARESQQRVGQMQLIGWCGLLGLLILLLLLGGLVFRPAVASLEATTRQLQQVSTRLQSVLDCATELAIIAIDEGGRITLFNSGAERLLGYRQDEVVGTKALTRFFLEEELRQHTIPAGFDAVNRPAGVGYDWSVVPLIELQVEREWTLQRKDGSQFPAGVVVTLMPGPGQTLAGYLLVARDISERRRVEAVLRQARASAEAASRAKSEFLANMSHELRTPLNSVIGFSNILLKNKANNLRESDLNYLRRIQDNGKHLLGLINTILDLAKVESGRMEVERSSVALDQLIRETIEQLQGQIGEKPVQLLAEVPADLPPLLTDAVKLKQIIINLCSNALKFTERGEVRVVVGVDASGIPEYLDVRDTGIGIPPDKREVIFEAFRQVDSGQDRKYGGTGLGLTISRSLCELLGYQLRLHASELGVGSTFRVWFKPGAKSLKSLSMPQLPTAPPPPALGSAGSATPPPPTFGSAGSAMPPPPTLASQGQPVSHDGPPANGERPLGARPLVLIIDDEADARVLLAQTIEELGMDTLCAESGRRGLSLARQYRPDLILLDLMMPEMSGWEVLAELKAHEQTAPIPVIVVSIVARDYSKELTQAAALIDKPAGRDDLLQAIHRELNRELTQAAALIDKPAGRDDLRQAIPYELNWPAGRVLLISTDPRLQQIFTTRQASSIELIVRPDLTDLEPMLHQHQPRLVLVDVRGPANENLRVLELLHDHIQKEQLSVVLMAENELALPPGKAVVLIIAHSQPTEQAMCDIIPRLLALAAGQRPREAR